MDLPTLLHEEAKLTVRKVEKKRSRVIQTQGHGCDVGAISISERYIGRLIDAVPAAIEEARSARSSLRGLVPILLDIPPAKLALLALQGTLKSIGWHELWGRTIRGLGRALETEAFAAGLTKWDRRIAKLIEQEGRALQGQRIGQKVKFTKTQAQLAGFKLPEWRAADRARAGAWLLNLLISTLPDVFAVDGGGEYKSVVLLPDAVALATKAVEEMIASNYTLLPLLDPPLPWTALRGGGAPQRRDTVIRTHFEDVRKAITAAIRDGTMQPALDGLNYLQSTAWTLNKRMVEVVEACAAAHLHIKGMPQKPQPIPTATDWAGMSKEAQQHFMVTKGDILRHNQRCVGDEIMMAFDLSTARLFWDAERWWTGMNMDFRGRVYSQTMFNYQRDDRVRAMFWFADGEPIGEEGLRWLKIHVANTGAFEKIDKAPLDARVAWSDGQIARLRRMTADPMVETWWHQADKPFLFLAACFELCAAMDTGPAYICRLPVSFDGSCSGLQHLACMTRAPEGSLVNLTPSTVPQDVYAEVAAHVSTRLMADASTPWGTEDAHKGEIARQALAYGVDRKLTKTNVMTFCYGSKPHGMAGQQQEDLMDKLTAKKVSGDIAEHPFGAYARGTTERPGKAARYLAGHCYAATEETLNLPAQAMHMLRQIARALAHERKSAKWTTPAGIPWHNRYHEPIIERVELWMYDKGVRLPARTIVVTGDQAEVNKEKSANAIAPNFVHGCDAAHLLMVARAAKSLDLGPIATVHDSFGCLPSRATRFNAVIREELVRMYETHDVLAEILEQAKRDLTPANHHRLPTVPEYGTLDLKGILNAQFAFS